MKKVFIRWSKLKWLIPAIKESSNSDKGKESWDRSNKFLHLRKERLKKYRIIIEEIK